MPGSDTTTKPGGESTRRMVGWSLPRRSTPPAAAKHHRFAVVIVFITVVAIAVPALSMAPVELGVVNLWLVYSMIAVGFYFIFALSGQFALSQGFFALLGGFTSAYFATDHSFIVGLLAGIGIATVLSLLFALVMWRVNGFYLAIASLGLAQIGTVIIRKWEAVGGIDGTVIGIPPAELFGHVFFGQDQAFWLLLGGFAFVMLLAAGLESSPVRRELIAVQRNPVVAPTLGIHPQLVRVSAYMVGSVCAAFAGALYAHWQGFMSVGAFGIELSIAIFVMVLFGGTSSAWGAVTGAAFYVWVPFEFTFLAQYQDVFFGSLILLIIVFFPDGLFGVVRSIPKLLRRMRGGTSKEAVA